MIEPKIPFDEEERLKELYRFEVLDTIYEQDFDEIVELASRLFNTPISLITLVDVNRQWFKAKVGLEIDETPRNISFCGHALHSDGLFEVEDALKDERFFDNPLVTGDPKVRYYAGMPLVTSGGHKIGTLCVIDRVPRNINEQQALALKVLSRQVLKLFELRSRNLELDRISEVQQRMMTIIAHDVRGPLSSLKTSMDLKNDGILTEEESREIEQMLPAHLNNTITLVNNIVDWGKLLLAGEGGRVEIVHLHKVIGECFGHMALAANAKGNKLKNLVPENFVMKSNSLGTEFVLRNLLSNANKYTQGGEISVTAQKRVGATEICISDTGVGMKPEVLKAVVLRNSLTNTPGTDSEKGSGMGLRLVYEYLGNMGGSLNFSSTPGEGTTAIVTMPQYI